jgi:hypothetical protein
MQNEERYLKGNSQNFINTSFRICLREILFSFITIFGMYSFITKLKNQILCRYDLMEIKVEIWNILKFITKYTEALMK